MQLLNFRCMTSTMLLHAGEPDCVQQGCCGLDVNCPPRSWMFKHLV